LNVLKVTAGLKEQNLSNIRADDEPTIDEPSVANKVGADGWGLGIILPLELLVIHLKLVCVSQVVVLVDVFACHDDYFVVLV